MFSKAVTGLTLASDAASQLFSNITGPTLMSDGSFVATMRALLYNRVPKTESIHLSISRSSDKLSELSSMTRQECVRIFLRPVPIFRGERGVLHIHSFDGGHESRTACFNALDDALTDVIAGYTPLNDVSRWITVNGKFCARVYINRERKNTLIFCENLNLKEWHLLESLTPRYFPWYVGDAPLTEEEVALIKSLTKNSPAEYESRIEEFSKRFDLRSLIIREKLTGFETKLDRCKLDNIRKQISSAYEQIEQLEQKFSAYYKQIEDLTTQELGLAEKIRAGGGGESSELLDYFLLNKSIHLMNVTDSSIEFVVAAPMANFDPDASEVLIRNHGSYFYEDYDTGRRYENGEMTEARIERLLTEIFIKETLKIRLCAAYCIRFENGDFCGIERYSFPQDIAQTHIPNQHIQGYGCLGDNEKYIRAAMLKARLYRRDRGMYRFRKERQRYGRTDLWQTHIVPFCEGRREIY